MGHLGVVLYEYLGEEYPEVLGSILGALKAIVNVIGMCPLFITFINNHCIFSDKPVQISGFRKGNIWITLLSLQVCTR